MSRLRMRWAAVLAVAVLPVGCVVQHVDVPMNAGDPQAHVWQYLNTYGGEDKDYATYSYVLFGRDKNHPAVSLYFELAEAIQGSTADAGRLPEGADKSRYNLFLIPARGENGDRPREPDYELSKLLLATVSADSPENFSRPGPYIITLVEPISAGAEEARADILYVDLTNTHRSAIPEVVRAYKDKVLDADLSGIEKLRSLRLSLLNLALIAEDRIGFARTAYADMQEAFFSR